jgi:folate-binding protein YgfZ
MTDTLERIEGNGAFAAPATDLARLAREPVLARLDELGCIRASGPDAVSFLQSQLTSDVANLAPDGLGLGGYCTPKGRLLATLHLWRDGDDVVLQLPREILAPVLKRLSMYVLRAKAKLVEDSAAHEAWALLGPGSAARLAAAGVDAPSAPWMARAGKRFRVARFPAADGGERFLISAAAGTALPDALAGLPRVASGTWWWSEVAAAVPTVFAATQEKFVPQMLNLEVLGGVSFRKGCYPGQEIVARSQYLGKLRRRMQLGHAGVQQPPPAGSDIHHSEQDEAVGTVVMSAAAPGGGVDVLFEVPVDRLAAGSLHLDARTGPQLALHELPYVLFDPTA